MMGSRTPERANGEYKGRGEKVLAKFEGGTLLSEGFFRHIISTTLKVVGCESWEMGSIGTRTRWRRPGHDQQGSQPRRDEKGQVYT